MKGMVRNMHDNEIIIGMEAMKNALIMLDSIYEKNTLKPKGILMIKNTTSIVEGVFDFCKQACEIIGLVMFVNNPEINWGLDELGMFIVNERDTFVRGSLNFINDINTLVSRFSGEMSLVCGRSILLETKKITKQCREVLYEKEVSFEFLEELDQVIDCLDEVLDKIETFEYEYIINGDITEKELYANVFATLEQGIRSLRRYLIIVTGYSRPLCLVDDVDIWSASFLDFGDYNCVQLIENVRILSERVELLKGVEDEEFRLLCDYMALAIESILNCPETELKEKLYEYYLEDDEDDEY